MSDRMQPYGVALSFVDYNERFPTQVKNTWVFEPDKRKQNTVRVVYEQAYRTMAFIRTCYVSRQDAERLFLAVKRKNPNCKVYKRSGYALLEYMRTVRWGTPGIIERQILPTFEAKLRERGKLSIHRPNETRSECPL